MKGNTKKQEAKPPRAGVLLLTVCVNRETGQIDYSANVGVERARDLMRLCEALRQIEIRLSMELARIGEATQVNEVGPG